MDAEGVPEVSMAKWLAETASLILLAFLAAQGIKLFLFQPYVVPTGSMVPTIQLKDRVLADKFTLRFREPKPGDIVVFDNPNKYARTQKIYIKRVIATEGDVVDVRDDRVIVNGAPLSEPYVHGKPTMPGSIELPVTVPEGHVWLMGDNRTNSTDSRWFGPRPVSEVHGRAFYTYWPLANLGRLE